MRFFLWLLLFYLTASLFSSANIISRANVVVRKAESHIGTTETGRNRGKMVNKYLKSVDLGPGYSWCAAFVRYVLDEANVAYPNVRSAVATKYITRRSIKAKHVAKGYEEIYPGWLVIWRKYSTWKGHIGIVVDWDGQSGTTIEGNTSNSDYGSQRDGDGVWKRNRSITNYKAFRIVAFTPTEVK